MLREGSWAVPEVGKGLHSGPSERWHQTRFRLCNSFSDISPFWGVGNQDFWDVSRHSTLSSGRRVKDEAPRWDAGAERVQRVPGAFPHLGRLTAGPGALPWGYENPSGLSEC